MKCIFSVFLLCCALHSSAQFAIVADKDGFINVREDAGSESKIADKLNNGHLIYCFENKGNWTNINYTHNNIELNGYVYKDNYKSIDDYLNFSVEMKSSGKIVLQKNSILITITSAVFDKKKHRFKYLKDFPDQIDLIDNNKYWGKDGGMPSSQYQRIEIIVGNKKISLPAVALEGLYEPNIYSTTATFDIHNNIIYIQSLNGDGAGGYEVVWKIENGNYRERLVVYGF